MHHIRAPKLTTAEKKHRSVFKPSLLSMAIAAAALPSVGFAQSDEADQGQNAMMTEEIVVTGFRRSLQNAMDIKQDATSIVEAISAEDIGKLPDTSIAESLARLPGLAGERRDGRTSGISVRGFNENYVATTMNGREILGIGDNRGVEYDLYPAEIIAGAVVYKSPDATLINQGLGGTVNLQTIRPLENDRIISVNGSYEMNSLESSNPDFDDTGYRLAATYSDKFADDTLGLAVTVASMESPSQEEQMRVWGYPDIDGDGPSSTVIQGGHDTFARSAMMERDTISGVLQYEPTARLSMTLDAIYIDFKDSKVFRGLEEGGPIWGGSSVTYDILDVENDLVTAGEFTGFHSVIRNDGEVKDAELTTVGFNAVYDLTDDWSVELDVATGESSKTIANIESYSGVGRAGSAGQGAPAARSWVMTSKGIMFGPHSTISMPDYSNPDNIRLAGPQAWGGGMAPAVDGRNDAQDGFINKPSFDEELQTFRLSTRGDLDFSIFTGVELGAHYSDREKSKVNYGAYLTAPEYFDENGNIVAGDAAIPEEYIVGTTDLGFYGLGSIVAYDGMGLYEDGVYVETDATEWETGRLGDTWTVAEQVATLYGMAEFEMGIMTGNLGLQVVNSEQESRGYETFTGAGSKVTAIPRVGGADYTKVLPSMNLNFQVTDDQVFRVAAAKTASRPRMDDMIVNYSVNFSFDEARRLSDDPNFSAWSANLGNPELEPLEAVQLDFSYEWYFSDEGFIAAAYYYKDLKNWHLNSTLITDFSEYIVPGYHDGGIPALASTQGPTTTIIEAGDGFAKGTEFQVNLPFNIMSDALDGLGLLASATFPKGEIEYQDQMFEIPGKSDEIYGLTVYYEKNGFEFRVSGRKRDEYQTEFYGTSLALTQTTDQGAELWDAQIGYNFSESGIRALDGLTIRLQGQNLTDEDTISAASNDPRQINKYQHFGANYVLSFNYKI